MLYSLDDLQRALLVSIARVIGLVTGTEVRTCFDKFKDSLLKQLQAFKRKFPTDFPSLSFDDVRKLDWKSAYGTFYKAAAPYVPALVKKLSNERSRIKLRDEPWLCLTCKVIQARSYLAKKSHACYWKQKQLTILEGVHWKKSVIMILFCTRSLILTRKYDLQAHMEREGRIPEF